MLVGRRRELLDAVAAEVGLADVAAADLATAEGAGSVAASVSAAGGRVSMWRPPPTVPARALVRLLTRPETSGCPRSSPMC
jgi:hypothetical protein